MKRAGRWARRIATGLGVAAFAVVGLWVWAVPALVRRTVVEEFAAFGLPQPTFRICGLSPSHLAITDLAVGEDDRLRIGAVGVEGGIAQLLFDRVDAVEIIGFEVEVRRRDGAWDFGPLADLSTPAGIKAGAELPFGRIVLRASTLVFDLDGRRLRVPFHGSMQRAGATVLAVDLTATALGADIRAVGTVDVQTKDFRLALTVNVPDLAVFLTAGKPPSATVPNRDWGGLAFEADLTREKGVMSLDATARGAGWTLSRVEARETGLEALLRGSAARAEIRVQWDGTVEDLRPRLKATPLGRWLDGTATARVDLSGEGAVALRRPKGDAAPGWTWSATVPEARATLALSHLAIPPADAALEGVRARLRLAATADPDRLRVEVRAGSFASVAGISTALRGAGIAFLESDKPAVDGVVHGKPLVASLALGKDEPQWRVTLPEARLTLAECNLSFPRIEAAVNGLAGTLVFEADANPEQVTLLVRPGAWIGIGSAVLGSGDEAVRVGAARFALPGSPNQDLLLGGRLEGGRLHSASGTVYGEAEHPITMSVGEELKVVLGTVPWAYEVSWGQRGVVFRADSHMSAVQADFQPKVADSPVAASVRDASLRLEVTREQAHGPAPAEPLRIEFELATPEDGAGARVAAGGAEATGRIEARGTVALSGAPPHAIDARVSLTDASVRHKDAGLVLSGITADVPLAWNVANPPPAGTFAFLSIRRNGDALPPLSGTLGIADGRADFTVDWPVLRGADLHAEGTAEIKRRGPAARATVSLPLFQVEDEDAIGRLIPPLEGMLIGGSFALDGYVRASPDGITPNIALTVLDGTFKSKEWKTEAEGVYATVGIDRLSPVLTPRKELQVALVRRASIGKLEVKDGFVAFRIEPKPADGPSAGWTAWVQRGEWGWAGGRLVVQGFRYDPDAAEHTAVVHAHDLKLRRLMDYIPNQEATGVGSLDGRLTVTVGTWPDLRFGEGELQTPPGQPGWFKIKRADALGDVLDRANPRFRTDELYGEIKERLVSAFGNFEYDQIRLVLTEEDGQVVGRVKTRGRGRTGAQQEFGGITLNLWGFDSVLRDAILIGRGAFGD